jgi:UDP-N-acetylglucosamine--N-acetylmuramyl-(pentapeptide) pyrophosphoryl-undecaprenol N-acetylglucosamine transferase
MTGGGVFPALAVLQTVKDKTSDVLWIGSEGGMEAALLKDPDLRFETIPAAGVHGVSLLSLPGNLLRLARGYFQAGRIIRAFKPDAMFFTGGYLGVPVAYAGKRIPSVVFVPDIEPGLALKEIIRTSKGVAVSVPDSSGFIKHQNIEVAGYPVRKELSRWNRRDARNHFKIGDNEKVLLVFGGSKGARSINQALAANLEALLPHMHIIHVSGRDLWHEIQSLVSRLDDTQRKRYHAYPFLDEEMGAALAAADLVVCRAGASTLGELPLFGLPALLVPYPYAWRYQRQNAEFLCSNGGAQMIEDQNLGSRFMAKVSELMNDPDTLNQMSRAMKALSRPDAAEKIAEMIVRAARSSQPKEAVNG